MPSQAIRQILAFLNTICEWHPEQCTLAEYSAFIARDVMAHVDLAAEARITETNVASTGGIEEDAQSEPEETDNAIKKKTR